MKKTSTTTHKLVPFLYLFCTLFLIMATINVVTADNEYCPSDDHLQLPVGNEKKQFVLVHAAGHGAWSWYKVATLLTSAGHNVTALDMAGSGKNPTPVQDMHSFTDYSAPLIEFMTSLPPQDKVILVAHSMGGASVSTAMEMFPHKIYAAVFVNAAMPGPALKYSTISLAVISGGSGIASQFVFDQGPKNPPTSLLFKPDYLASKMYQLSPPEDLTLANSLMRPAPVISEVMELTEEKYGSVPRVFISSDQDTGYTEKVVKMMFEKNPPNEAKVINGADHMVVASRPVELFSHLQEIAEKYN